MGIFQRFERRLEGLVNGTFARVFRSAVQPVEIAAELQRELDRSAQILSRDSSLVPNDFAIELSPTDHERLAPYAGKLSQEMIEVVNNHAATQHYAFTGPVAVTFEQRDGLPTGRFRVRSSAVADVAPRRDGAQRRPGPPPPQDRQHGRQPGGPPQSRQGPQQGSPRGSGPPGPGAPNPMGSPPAGQPPAGPPPGTPPPPGPGQPPPRGPAETQGVAETQAFAPPPRPQPPVLEVNGVRHVLEPPGMVIGRGSDADLRITDPGISRRHAEVRVAWTGSDYSVTVHDLGSTNATVVNGRRIEQAELSDGAQILLGNTVLVLRRGTPSGEAHP